MAVVENNNNFKDKHGQDGEEQDEEEALSLCDLPTAGRENCESNEACSIAYEAQDFEFSSWVEEDRPSAMCAADDVFFQGQILPLRPSVSSEGGLLSGFRTGSRSDSMERSLGTTGSSSSSSCVFTTSSSSNSNRSSSRSHSLSSSSSTYNFHSHPTPKPHMGSHHLRRNTAAKPSRKSSTGWGLFRLGLVKTPEIELQDLKLRKKNSVVCKKNESMVIISSGRRSTSSSTADIISGKRSLLEKKGSKQDHQQRQQGFQRFLSGGLGCKCSADAVETVSSRIVILKSRRTQVGDHGEEEEESLQGKQAMSHRRTFEWLRDQLSIAETPVA